MSKHETSAIRVFLIADHKLFLAGLSTLIDKDPGLTVVGQAVNSAEALMGLRTRPDIILLDLDLGGESSLDFLPDLLKVADGARVVVVTGVRDPELHLSAVRLGAMGVVSKLESVELLFKAVRKVHAGEVWLNHSMVSTVITEILQARMPKKADPETDKIADLTARELDVIALVAEGLRNKQIGERLFISEKTVRHYLTSIFEKLEVTDRLALLIYSYQYGLAKIPSPCPSKGNGKVYSTKT